MALQCNLETLLDENISDVKLVTFGSIPVDTAVEKTITIENKTDDFSHLDSLHTNCPFIGPRVKLDKKKLVFTICKNVTEQRKEVINIVNKSSVDTTYQWYMPASGQGCFQISTGNCGLIRAFETITTTVVFTGIPLGIYTGELVCLVLHQVSHCSLNVFKLIEVDPDNIFLVDPIASVVPPNESRLFTVRFRPKIENEVYGYLMCGDYQVKKFMDITDEPRIKHSLFRIPCTGNTWMPCTEWMTEWDCPSEVILPPTVPTRTTFANFMLSNKFEIPMHFKFDPPYGTNFVVMPVCGIVPSRGWQIISVALEPKCFGDYCEAWDLIINKVQKTCISFTGNAEMSQVDVMSHGYHPATHAMLEFPPTITGCTNYCTSYLHNLTRMDMQILSNVDWLGADDCGSIILPPKEIVHYHWWFFPKIPDKVYETTITLSCVCLIKGQAVGEPTEVFIAISGFSEFPDLRNSLKPSNHCEVKMTVTPDGAGSRRLRIKYTVLYRTEFNEVEEVKRTLSIKCPVILSNHCVWNIVNVEELNQAFEECRPNNPIGVNIYAPDLCVRTDHVELVFVMGCVYQVPVPWSLRREQICDCDMIQVKIATSKYEMRHTCEHRELVELYPSSGIVSIVWLYNPTEVFTTWRLLRGNTIPDSVIRCLLYFAEVPPLGKLAIPFAFMPTEMIDYEVYLSMEHLTLPVMPTHSLSRDIISICNDTDHIMRFIWLPTTVACEILDLTDRKNYQQNELLKRKKIEKCNQEFIITEEGTFYPDINDSPPYVLDLEKPQPRYLAMTVSVSSKGQRDGYPRMLLKQMWQQIEYYSKEEVPTYGQLLRVYNREVKPELSRRVTSGICDAIVNKAVFHNFGLNAKQSPIMEAE
ncbi:hypothetical protein HF086_013375 [Spodoptera exigua]|uniref:Coiled-coil domain-containing protein 108 n=1 Tax=Spodoptera exigua TaxID=7107 RepID=A0A922MJF4_SPOEX|nr:hypothetical protein HF086_013375 [Spodoptera exigua]